MFGFFCEERWMDQVGAELRRRMIQSGILDPPHFLQPYAYETEMPAGWCVENSHLSDKNEAGFHSAALSSKVLGIGEPGMRRLMPPPPPGIRASVVVSLVRCFAHTWRRVASRLPSSRQELH